MTSKKRREKEKRMRRVLAWRQVFKKYLRKVATARIDEGFLKESKDQYLKLRAKSGFPHDFI
ncbi:MAG: hypothetical protein OXB88_10260 [Bacteriovoracales bacterium]|nr:hypothetical protein [Bacteriovoracales bacterium]